MTSPGTQKNKKPLKDTDLGAITYFLRIAGLALPFLCLLGLYIGFVRWGLFGAISGLIVTAAAGLILSYIVMHLLNAVSGAASGLLFGRRTAVWTTREQVQGFLSQARFNKENKEFKAASAYVNKVLEKDPDYPEALFLKATILWEGFGDIHGSMQFLQRVLSLEDENEGLHHTASRLYDDLSQMERPPKRHVIPEGIGIGLTPKSRDPVQKFTGITFEELKTHLAEMPMAVWAICISIVFSLFLLCVMVSMDWKLAALDQASNRMQFTVEKVMESSKNHMNKVQQADDSIKHIESRVNTINKKVKKR